MDFRFAQYRFDTATLMLWRGEEILALRNNEAKLLAYFLGHPGQVLSKEQILDTVWAGKVVSEQAVFQAVSNLRQQFGEDAIKTFPKKGYQWQIALDTEAPASDSHSNTALDGVSPAALAPSPRRLGWWVAGALGALFLLALGLLFKAWAPAAPTQQPVPLLLRIQAPAQAALGAEFQAALLQRLRAEPALQAGAAPPEYSEAQLMAAPQHYARALFEQPASTSAAAPTSTAGLLLTGRVQRHGDQLLLSFSLQGRENRWFGDLSAGSAAQLEEQLAALLRRVAAQRVLWESKDQRLVNAQLQLLHSEAPQSLPILRNLVGNLLAIGDSQAAQLRADELLQQAKQAQDLPHQVHALHALARLALEAEQTQRAQDLLDQALALGRELQDARLQALTLERYFSVHLIRQDFAALEETLLQALRLAQTAQNPARESELLFALTLASYKFQLDTKQDFYLAQTRALFDKLQLPSWSYAELEFFTGLNSATPAQAEQLYKAALQRFAPGEAAPAKERAMLQLVQLYLKQGRSAEALALVEREPKPNAAELLLLARIHFTQPKQQGLALQKAEAAFRAGNLAGDYLTTLDAALFLAERRLADGAAEAAQPYRDYIGKNATPQWLRQNQAALKGLQAKAKTEPD
ncbi:winged helix-turn-helix domain-containing protein [Roseateles oligotrophus]|uniref:Winged helix-turn-helix domain-containing protein n=1 Tax=Roseateles oligotrophus TaxID=1769250 RepID=A0ABT2YD24_9BURK|nr:winged helix-turn-helix domain-containing protein [Roseateles oligotrophus]MCV2367953.1 winged helix-turn-helix domain-containing protein [Roseateles oligotrophus]